MYEGGYFKIHQDLVKAGIHKHTGELEQAIPQAQLDALNRIQETPWRVNPHVHAVLLEAIQSNSMIAGLPSMSGIPLPDKLPDHVWASMSDEEKGRVKAEREIIWSKNAKMQGRRELLLRQMTVANDLLGQTFWFPHNVDWRGRAYAISQDLTPQSDDVSRGLLEFAEGRPLGKQGCYHLALRAASSFGMDKVSFDERVQWFVDNERLVIDSATNPLDGERFWCEADEPWQFLATCFAWVGWLNEGEDYVCHLPIPYDATCSGLQHLSAMGLSSFGGTKVNLTSDACRHDIYQTVADMVCQLIERDMQDGLVEAYNWHGKVGRKTVKRQVMTICYGATPMGMRKMAMDDGHTDGLEGRAADNARYITKLILEAIEGVLTEGKLIMDWLQDCAGKVAEVNAPLDFTTPMGMRVRQAYWKRGRHRISTLLGDTILWEENADLGMDKNRMRNGAVPNVIHAYDASHLYATINSTTLRMGEEVAWAVVHDSFATWAGEPSVVMNECLREEFVRIYEQDQLSRLYEEFSYSGASIPTPPKRGDLDITEVLRSRYFFS